MKLALNQAFELTDFVGKATITLLCVISQVTFLRQVGCKGHFLLRTLRLFRPFRADTAFIILLWCFIHQSCGMSLHTVRKAPVFVSVVLLDARLADRNIRCILRIWIPSLDVGPAGQEQVSVHLQRLAACVFTHVIHQIGHEGKANLVLGFNLFEVLEVDLDSVMCSSAWSGFLTCCRRDLHVLRGR